MSALSTLTGLLIEEIGNIDRAKDRPAEALPRFVGAAQSEELRKAFETPVGVCGAFQSPVHT